MTVFELQQLILGVNYGNFLVVDDRDRYREFSVETDNNGNIVIYIKG